MHRIVGLAAGDRGSVVVFLAFAIVPLIGFVGIGTDVTRAYLVKSRLSSALDAAGLAGGRSFFLPTRDADIQMFFAANFPAGYMDATVSGPDITVDTAAEKISLAASATVPTTFMRLFGFDTLSVSADAEVTRRMTGLDVVLAVDNSGSMNWPAIGGGSRIQAARTAATELVNILFGANETKEKLHIGLVPWNGKVNITLNGTVFDPALTSSQAVSAFTNPENPSPNPASPPPPVPQNQVFLANNSPVPLLESPPANWQGCVYSRFINDNDATTDADVLFGMVQTSTTDWVAWQPIGPEGEPVPGSARCVLSVNGECRPCLDHGITPLQNTKQVILDSINSMSPTGTTNITQGLGWAWRVLMPEPPFTEAIPNPPYARIQAIVLLTDGENFAGSGDGYKTTFGTGLSARLQMDDRLRLIAANIKAQGVLIYVIQFANEGTDLQTLLKEVASGPDSPYYNLAPDAATLQSVFVEVANHLSQLRLSK